MRIAIIGRSELLFSTAQLMYNEGYEIPLIITAKEAPEYTKTAQDYQNLAQSIGAKFINTAKINSPEVLNQIKSLPLIDIAISINYSGVIAQEVIDIFPLGILNAHGGDLPRYRGNACQAWAIINGENRIGLCIHKMIGGELDSGDIIIKDFYFTDINTRIGQVWSWMESRIPPLFLEAIKKLSVDPGFILESQSKNSQDALRCYPRMPEDGKLNWKNDAESILRLINASSEPYAGAFCEYEGESLIIWRAELFEDEEAFLAVPGQICRISDAGVVIATGCGKVLISEVEYQSQRINPNSLIRSIRRRLR